MTYMHTHRGLLGALTLLGALACAGSRGAGAGGSTTPVARDGSGNAITTATGQAVSEVAGNRFTEAATQMRRHDDANEGRGDWNESACNDVADDFEAAAREQNGGNFPEAWFNRGLVYLRCNMTDPARQAFERAVSVANGNYCRAKVQLGVMAYSRRDVGTAQQLFNEAIRLDPTHCVEGYTNLAMLLRERNPSSEPEWADVVRNIRLALALDDRYLPARNQLALAYLQQAGDDPNSQRIFLAGLVCQQAIQVAQAQQANISADVRGYVADLYNTWGVIDFRRREIIKALEHFQRAYTLRPSMYEAWVNYGTINLSFRGFRDARDAFQHAVELRGDSFDAHLGLGVALRGLSQEPSSANERETLLRQAQQEYERAQQLDQNRPESYYNQGLLHMSYTGNTIPELRQALTFLNNFVSRAGSQPRYADAVQRANRHIRNINETIAVLETNAPQGGSGTPPATPPTAPAPPAGGATPPAAGATPPAAARP